MENGLPKGWVSPKLSEVCEIIMGQSPPSETYNTQGIGLPFFQGKAEFTDLHPIVKKWCDSPNKIAEPNDILLSVRAPVGTTNIANQRCCIGRGLAAIRFENYKYVFYFLRSIEKQLDEKGTGTTFKAISGDTIRSTDFPLPPLPEQHRIVAKIEELFSELDHGVAQMRALLAQLKTYRQSVLKYAFEGKLTEGWRKGNPVEPAAQLLEQIRSERQSRYTAELAEWKAAKARGEKVKKPSAPKEFPPLTEEEVKGLPDLPEGWMWVTLDQLSDVSGGLAKNSKRNSWKNQLPYLRVANVYANELRLEEIKEIGVEENEIDKLLLQKGDLLIVEGNGSLEQIGRVAIWNNSISPCIHQNHLIKARPLIKDMSKFLLYWLLSPVGRNMIQLVSSSTSGLNTLSISKIKAFTIPLPPTAEQHQIVSAIESRLSICEQAEGVLRQELAQAEALRQSILKRAFEGKLVPQVAGEEPAGVLLERIKGEQSKK